MVREKQFLRSAMHVVICIFLICMAIMLTGIKADAASNNWGGPDFEGEFTTLYQGDGYYGMYYGSDKCVLYLIDSDKSTLNIPSTLSTPHGKKSVWGIISYSQYKGVEMFYSEEPEIYDEWSDRDDNYSGWEKNTPAVFNEFVKKIVVPSSVKFIGDCAFAENEYLTSFEAASPLTIGRRAFMNCKSLVSATYPAGTDLSFTAFYNCFNLKKITCAPGDIQMSYRESEKFHLEEASFAQGTKVISSGLEGITTLKKVTLPDTVTRIGIGAFSECESLSTINFPAGLTEIGDLAFSNCKNLKIAVTHKGNSLEHQYQGSGITSIKWNCDTIEYYELDAFNECKNLSSISINGGRFHSEDGVQYFTRDDDSQELVRYPPAKNKGGTFVVPDNVSVIDIHAFESCSLSTIKTPKVVLYDKEDDEIYDDTVEDWVDVTYSPFDNMGARCNIYYLPDYYEGKIDLTYGNVGYVTINGSQVKHNWIPYPSNPKGHVFIDDGIKYKVTSSPGTTIGLVTVIGPEKKTLKTVEIPDTVIGDDVYLYKVTGISKKAFKGCKNLKTVYLGSYQALYDSPATIGDSAFANCPKLTKVVIGDGAKTIGKSAFYKDAKLKSITIRSTKLKKVGKNSFKGIAKKAKIYVPAKKLKAYKKLLKGKGQAKTVKIVKSK